MSFVGSPSMPEGPQQEPELEAALRAAKNVLTTAAAGDRKHTGTAGALEYALQVLVQSVEADQRVFPRMRPVR